MLNSDVTEVFLSKFSPCFLKFAKPNIGPVYVTDTEDWEE